MREGIGLIEHRREVYLGLDIIRFGAALSVVFFHLGYWWWLPTVTTHPNLHTAFAPIAEPVRWGNVGVPIFFVLSGFIIYASAQGRSAGQFLRSRALRLYPAAWICGAITLAVAPESRTIWKALGTALLWPAGPWVSGVYWTLGVEIVFYLAVALFLWLRWNLWFLGAVVGSISLSYWLLRAADFAIGGHFKALFAAVETPAGTLTLIPSGCYFGLGMALWSIHDKGWTRWKAAAIPLFLLGGIVSNFAAARFVIARQGGAAIHAVEPAAIWIVSVALVAASVRWQPALWRRFSPWGPAVRTVGLATYPLYLVHSEVGRNIVLRLAPLGPWVALAVAVATAVALSFAVVYLEQYPRAAMKKLLGASAPRRSAADLP